MNGLLHWAKLATVRLILMRCWLRTPAIRVAGWLWRSSAACRKAPVRFLWMVPTDVILDIPVSISMEVGSTDINIRNLLQLNQGSVIELDRLAGEPLDVLVNGTLIAHGEVVVVNESSASV